MAEVNTPSAEQKRLARIATVTFGVYAWLEDTAHPISHAGSGVFVSRRLALTAKHVTEDMERLDSRYNPSKPAPAGFIPEYSTMLYQAERYKQGVLWANEVLFPSRDTDITVLEVVPDSMMAYFADQFCVGAASFQWHLRTPPVGSRVTLFGFPLPSLSNFGNLHKGHVQLVEQDGVVEEVFEPIRTHGMLEFPCYRLSKPVDHGFSGGPVLFDGALAGVVSAGSSFDNRAWVASLWPLTIMKYTDTFGVTRSFGDHFDSGRLVGRDWLTVKGKVTRKNCNEALSGTQVIGRCDREHAVLA